MGERGGATQGGGAAEARGEAEAQGGSGGGGGSRAPGKIHGSKGEEGACCCLRHEERAATHHHCASPPHRRCVLQESKARSRNEGRAAEKRAAAKAAKAKRDAERAAQKAKAAQAKAQLKAQRRHAAEATAKKRAAAKAQREELERKAKEEGNSRLAAKRKREAELEAKMAEQVAALKGGALPSLTRSKEAAAGGLKPTMSVPRMKPPGMPATVTSTQGQRRQQRQGRTGGGSLPRAKDSSPAPHRGRRSSISKARTQARAEVEGAKGSPLPGAARGRTRRRSVGRTNVPPVLKKLEATTSVSPSPSPSPAVDSSRESKQDRAARKRAKRLARLKHQLQSSNSVKNLLADDPVSRSNRQLGASGRSSGRDLTSPDGVGHHNPQEAASSGSQRALPQLSSTASHDETTFASPGLMGSGSQRSAKGHAKRKERLRARLAQLNSSGSLKNVKAASGKKEAGRAKRSTKPRGRAHRKKGGGRRSSSTQPPQLAAAVTSNGAASLPRL